MKAHARSTEFARYLIWFKSEPGDSPFQEDTRLRKSVYSHLQPMIWNTPSRLAMRSGSCNRASR